MNPFEWVGFFISAFAVFFLIGRAVYDAIQNEKNPSKYKAQQEEAERRFKAFLRGESPSPIVEKVLKQVIEEDDEEEEIQRAPRKKPAAINKPRMQEPPAIPPHTQQQPATVAHTENSRVKNILARESTKKNMVILSEVFGTPKGLR